MPSLTLAALIAAALGVVALGLGLRRFYQLRPRNACGYCFTAALLVAGGVLAGSLAAHLHSYDRLTQERDVLEIRFLREDNQTYTALVRDADSPEVQRFRVRGDEWQVDARMLKWNGPAMLAGMDSRYRLERLSGRYRDTEQARNGERTVYDLSRDRGVDLWSLVRDNSQYLPWVDAVYGSATYLPMADGLRYRVSVSQTGLLARPVDGDAETVVEAWQ